MKKFLLTTTALGLLASTTAFAEGPTVTLGGYADFQAGFAKPDSSYDDAAGFTRDNHTRTDTELHVSVDGKTDNGLGYGAYIELDANVNADDSTGNDNNAERSYIYVESGFGRLEAGANNDAADALRVDASSFARGSGGIAGDWFRYVNLSGNVAGPDAGVSTNYYILPGLATAVMPEEVATGVYENRATANKISYYTPRVQGLQFAVSYTPDQGERGTANGFSDKFSTGNAVNAPDFENVWNAGLNYEKEFSGVTIKSSLTGEIGDAEDRSNGTAATNDDLSGYALGLSASYAGATVGGSWAKIDELGRAKTANADANYWTVGAGYEYNAFGVSVGYLQSTIDNEQADGDSELSNLSLGADYKLAPGLVPYVEVSFFDTDDNNTATTDNDGSVVLVGTELNF